MLRQIGPRLARVLPERATIARLGGDEFAVLLPDVASERAATATAEAIRAELEAPFVIEPFDVELALGASIGIALYPMHGTSTDALLQRADVAMYVAKGSTSGIELYDPVQDRHSTRRLALMGQLRTAIAAGQILLHYQPKLDLRSDAVDEVEALVRWQHPDLGMIPPIEFIGIAEHTGLIRPLTGHVLELAATQVRAWQTAGIDMAVAVNLSTRSLHDSAIADEVDDCLARHGLTASALRLELTESAIMQDPDRSKLVLERLSAAGLQLSIDDYGTGYSSLAYLQDLPVREIKIDRSFVTNLVANSADQVIVRSTIELAHNLGLTATAEGVETREALDWLVSAGCDHAQGYHIARPMPGADVSAWLSGRDGVPPNTGGQRNQAGRAGFVVVDLVGVRERDADVVEPVQEAVLRRRRPSGTARRTRPTAPRPAAAPCRRRSASCGSASISSHSRVTDGSGSTTGISPFFVQLLRKMSLKLGAITASKPPCWIAHTACSRDEPTPNAGPATRIDAPW